MHRLRLSAHSAVKTDIIEFRLIPPARSRKFHLCDTADGLGANTISNFNEAAMKSIISFCDWLAGPGAESVNLLENVISSINGSDAATVHLAEIGIEIEQNIVREYTGRGTTHLLHFSMFVDIPSTLSGG